MNLGSALATVGRRASSFARGGLDAAARVGRAVRDRSSRVTGSIARRNRAGLDAAYATKQPEAAAAVARIRHTNPTFTPAQVMAVLDKDFRAAESRGGETFNAAVARYVLAAVEVQGTAIANPVRLQRLIDVVVVIDSHAAKLVARYGGAAVALLLAKFGGGKAGAVAGKALAKAAWLPKVLAAVGIRNAGKGGAAVVTITATRRVLGPVPDQWPASVK